FAGVAAWPPAASLFGLSPLQAPEGGFVALAVLAWLLVVRLAWRNSWITRFLGIPVAGTAASTARPPEVVSSSVPPPACSTSAQQDDADDQCGAEPNDQIGRASCRERV